ncbi:MAG: hypothetical protein KBA33_03650 [Cloacibacterium sp.]|nr:hypothetical protein [Cloacibacterium sp.]
MKKLLYGFILVAGLGFSQKMPDISDVWKNKGAYYKGNISQDNMPIDLKIEEAGQDPNNDHDYWVAGFSTVENHTVKFKGKINIRRFKNSKNKLVMFGTYQFDEEKGGEYTGIFKGKLKMILDFDAEKDHPQNAQNQYVLEFNGDWKNYIKTLNFKTYWKNK